MCRWHVSIPLAVLVVIVVLPATAGIYKWTDAQGNVQYGDHPPPDENVEQINIKEQIQDASTALTAEVKPAPEKDQHDSQEFVPAEKVFYTDYQVPQHQCFDAYEGDLSSIDIRPGYAANNLAADDIKNLTILFKKLYRRWDGDLVKIECSGTINKPREEREYFTTRISGQWRMTGQLELEIDYQNREKSSRQHYYWWLIEDTKLYFGDHRDIRAALKWNIDLEFVSPEKLVFSKKVYRANVKQIQVKEVAVVSRSLYMTELLYTNGLLTSIYYWRLN